MFRLRCFFRYHDWKLVAVNRGYYFNTDIGKRNFVLSFYECKRCKARCSTSTAKKVAVYSSWHNGAEFARQAWEETRMLPPDSRHPEAMQDWQRPEEVVIPVHIKDNVIKLERPEKR